MLRSRKQRDLKSLAFLVRIQTVDPSAFEMPDAPANEAGVLFIFEGGLQEVRFTKRTSDPVNVLRYLRPQV